MDFVDWNICFVFDPKDSKLAICNAMPACCPAARQCAKAARASLQVDTSGPIHCKALDAILDPYQIIFNFFS